MMFYTCEFADDAHGKGFCVPEWVVYSIAVIIFLLLVTILIVSICLCRVCRRTKKRKMREDNSPAEANLHYAELQNLPVSGRGQCDGGTCPSLPAAQSSDYATVAELMESAGEEGFSHEQKEDQGMDDGIKESQSCMEPE